MCDFKNNVATLNPAIECSQLCKGQLSDARHMILKLFSPLFRLAIFSELSNGSIFHRRYNRIYNQSEYEIYHLEKSGRRIYKVCASKKTNAPEALMVVSIIQGESHCVTEWKVGYWLCNPTWHGGATIYFSLARPRMIGCHLNEALWPMYAIRPHWKRTASLAPLYYS